MCNLVHYVYNYIIIYLLLYAVICYIYTVFDMTLILSGAKREALLFIFVLSFQNGPIGSLWKIMVVWFLRELWTLPIFLGGAFSKEINWRGQHYKLMNGGKAIKLN